MPRNSKEQYQGKQPKYRESKITDSQQTIPEVQVSKKDQYTSLHDPTRQQIPPSNGVSDQELSSQYLRYLSLLVHQDEIIDDEHELFWDMTYKSILYLKREHEYLNIQMHHLLMGSLFKQHFNTDRLEPMPISEVGKQASENGYVLAAYALFMVEKRRARSVLKYYKEIFQNKEVRIGREQMKFYLNMLINRINNDDRSQTTRAEPAVRRSFDRLELESNRHNKGC